MKKAMMILSHIILLSILINNVEAQTSTKKRLSVNDTIQLKEVIISEGFTIDTTIQKIQFILEMQPVRNEPCEYLSFMVLYNDFSGMVFEMGPIININDVYWVFHQDSLVFFSFSSKVYDKVKLLKNTDEIANYILDNGIRDRFGSRAAGFDCLIQDTSGCYRTYNKYSIKNSYLYKKVEKLSDCKLEFYNRIIGKK